MKSLLFVSVAAVILGLAVAHSPPERIGEPPGPLGDDRAPPKGGGGPHGPIEYQIRNVSEGIERQSSVGVRQISGLISSGLNERGGGRGGDRGGDRGGQGGNHEGPRGIA